MINTRLYKVLTNLDKPMLNRFIKFVQSPYHNVNESITQLSEILVGSIKNEAELPSKQELWKILKLIGKYQDVKFRKLCNDTLERFENFLIYEQLDSNRILKSNLLIESIKNINIIELAEKTISRSNKILNRELDQSSEYFLQKYLYEKHLLSLKSKFNVSSKKINSFNNNQIQELSKLIDVYYIIEKLRFAADSITLRKLYNTKIDVDLHEVLSIIEKHNLVTYPAIKVYLYVYKILTEEKNFKNYSILKEYAHDNLVSFPVEEQRVILDSLFSFCIKQINLDNEKFLHELLGLYDWGIDSEIILIKGVLSHTSFSNYIVSGLRAGEFDRVEQFIRNKSHLLEESKRENAVNFNLARVFFYKKDYNKVLEFLNRVNYEDVWYNLNSKNYLLTTYYELGEHFVLESQIESFQTFLRRQKSVQGYRIKNHSNFVKYLKKVHKTNPAEKEKLEKLRIEISEETSLYNKSWLLKKIDELL